MTELIVAPPRDAGDSWVSLLKPAAELARVISTTEFVPKDMRGRDSAIVAAVMTGHELQVAPMTALQNIAIIDGKPAISATLMRALFLARGHDLWFEEQTAVKVVIAGRRRGSDNVTRVTWTRDMAQQAGLLNRQNWQRYTRAMLEARASAELIRLIGADVLAGLTISAEELQDDVAGDGSPDGDAGDGGSARTRRRRRDTVPVIVDAIPDEQPPLPEPEPEPSTPPGAGGATGTSAAPGSTPPSNGQTPAMKRMHTLLGKAGITARDDRLAVATLLLQKPVASSTELSESELDSIANTLQDHIDGKVHLFRRATDGQWELVDRREEPLS